jgi:hypothetical protein
MCGIHEIEDLWPDSLLLQAENETPKWELPSTFSSSRTETRSWSSSRSTGSGRVTSIGDVVPPASGELIGGWGGDATGSV